ncbi:MAG TPA: DUF6325 family protein [Caldilineaceae bacterium]|nr:DUF6325 family protein [Caldilineaceae bacterium]
MTYGPIQFIVVGFRGNQFRGEILPELASLVKSGMIRVIDLLVVKKGEDEDIEVLQASTLSEAERADLAALAGALIGLGAAGVEGAELLADANVESIAERDYFGFDEDDIEEIIEDLPDNSSAAVLLFEHTWAIPFKQAIQRAGGEMIAQGLISPQALVALGEMMADED